MAEEIESKKEMYQDHPRINSVTHKFKGEISWEKAFEQVVNSRLRRLKLVD